MAFRKATETLVTAPLTFPKPPALVAIENAYDKVSEIGNEEEEEGSSASSTHMTRKRQSMSKRAGLTFPVARAVKHL
jgi:hypothetical protein